nr:uncharacterized protein LOC119165557 [Rhipicephalus microplus]
MYKKVFVAMIVLYIAGKTNTKNYLTTPDLYRYSIKQFFKTSERIWMCRASKRTAIRYQYDQTVSIDAVSIIFNRTFWSQGRRHSIQLQGQFNPRRKDRMDVSSRGIPAVLRETMIYEAPNSSCAIVKLRPNIRGAASYYELRVKNTCNRALIHRQCLRHYRNLTDQEKQVHEPERQHLVDSRE